MKLSLRVKVLVAAVALACASGAQAALVPTEIGFYASNGSSNSVFFDLGMTMSQFGPSSLAAGSTITWDLVNGTVTPSTPGSTSFTYGAVWTGFTFSSTTQWGVIGGDVVLGDIVSTSANPASLVGSTTGAQAFAAGSSVTGTTGDGGVYYPALNNVGTHPTADNGASFAIDGNALHFNGFFADDRWRNQTPFVAGTAGDSGSLPFYYLTYLTDPGPVGLATYAGVWKLNAAAGTLTYEVAVIPEPSSYLLLGAGLVMLGAIARRRLNG